VHPAALVPRAGTNLIERLPEAERAIADGNFRGDLQLTLFDVDQQLTPALRALPHADPISSFLPSGVAPISTSMHLPWSSMRACRKTPSAHT
jgi:hypothetical protein